MQKRTKLVLSILAGVMAITAVFGAVSSQVFAQASTPAAPTQSAGTGQLPPGPGRGGRGGHAGYTDVELASALGITTDQLTAAYKTANTEALQQAVSQGLITQAQADQIAVNAGTGPIHFGFPGNLGGTNTIDYNALFAKALNITTDQLKAAQQKAMNSAIDAAVQAGTMTQAQADEIKGENALANDSTFQSAMKAAFDAALKQAVSSGVITQAQADAISQRQAQSNGFFEGGLGGGHGHGRPGGPGGPDFNGGLDNTTLQNN